MIRYKHSDQRHATLYAQDRWRLIEFLFSPESSYEAYIPIIFIYRYILRMLVEFKMCYIVIMF